MLLKWPGYTAELQFVPSAVLSARGTPSDLQDQQLSVFSTHVF